MLSTSSARALDPIFEVARCASICASRLATYAVTAALAIRVSSRLFLTRSLCHVDLELIDDPPELLDATASAPSLAISMATTGTARVISLRRTFAGGDFGIVAPEDVTLLFKDSLRELGTE